MIGSLCHGAHMLNFLAHGICAGLRVLIAHVYYLLQLIVYGKTYGNTAPCTAKAPAVHYTAGKVRCCLTGKR